MWIRRSPVMNRFSLNVDINHMIHIHFNLKPDFGLIKVKPKIRMISFLFTGRVRTFASTAKLIRDHLLIPNSATYFIYAELGDPADLDLLNQTLQLWDSIPGSVATSTGRSVDFEKILNFLLSTQPALRPSVMNRTGISVNYLKSSGSILEYYQFIQVYDLMLKYEKQHHIKFDVVVRTRLDVIFTDRLDLKSFFEKEVSSDPLTLEVEVEVRGLGNDRIISNLNSNIKFLGDPPPSSSPLNPLWTFRKNVVWIGRRSVMDRLYPLLYWYGAYDDGTPYTFNSETQFQLFCKNHNINLIDYYTEIEEQYLVSKRSNTSLIEDQQLGTSVNPRLIMAIVRPPNYRFDSP